MIAEELREAIRVLTQGPGPTPARNQPGAEGLAQHGAPGAARGRARQNAVRIGEVLAEAHGIEIAYSTLTRLIREHTELRTPKKRSGIYTFGPGEEMQHDTSPHHLLLAHLYSDPML